jgi:hypothetical protein
VPKYHVEAFDGSQVYPDFPLDKLSCYKVARAQPQACHTIYSLIVILDSDRINKGDRCPQDRTGSRPKSSKKATDTVFRLSHHYKDSRS